MKGKIFRCFEDKAFGFAKIQRSDVFVHTTVLSGTTDNLIGQSVYLRIVEDKLRGTGSFKAVVARRDADHWHELAQEKAARATASAVRAAGEAQKRAEVSQAVIEAVELAGMRASRSKPPGLARFPGELMDETSVVEVIESTSEQKVDTVTKAEPVVESMGRSEPSDNDATSKARAKPRTRTTGTL